MAASQVVLAVLDRYTLYLSGKDSASMKFKKKRLRSREFEQMKLQWQAMRRAKMFPTKCKTIRKG